MRYIALIVIALAHAACGSSTPPTPTAQASALLSKAGATATSPVYMVGFDTSNSECSTGAAEADDTLAASAGNGEQYVDVCVFPSNAQLVSYISAGTQYGAGAALIQVGQMSLIIVEPFGNANSPPASLVQSIAGKTGGQVDGNGNTASAAPSVNPDEAQCNLMAESPNEPPADSMAQPIPGESPRLAALLGTWAKAVDKLPYDVSFGPQTTADQNAADAAGRAVASWCTGQGYPTTYTP